MVERFKADLNSLWNGKGKLGIAVSGGPDSLALLLLAQAAFPDQVCATTVDHGLREANADEASMVAVLCGEIGVPHAILPVAVDQGNIQSNARMARYAALDAWAAAHDVSAIATAHHADDQAETFLMRLNRGSGLAGLSGIRRDTVSPSGKTRVLRPLLDWRKAELERCVADAGIEAAQDPSNADDRFDRARMRKHLAEADWLDVEAIARSASHLASAQDAFDALAKQQMETNVARTGARYVYRPAGPAEVQMLVMERLIGRFEGAPRRPAIAELRKALLAGQRGNLAGVLVTNVGGAWRFEAEPPRSNS